MKKLHLLKSACILAVVVLFVSCGSKPVAETPSQTVQAPVPAKHIERVMVDWKGASVGAEVPAWVYDAVESDYSSLSKLPQLSKKKIICAEGQGKNLDLLKSWVNNFDVQSTYSKSISNFVTTNFGGELSGSKDSEISENFLDELTASFSKQEINGLSKELDFWVLTRTIDNDKQTSTDIYEYFVVYAIDQVDFDYQVSEALGLVKAKNDAEEKLKSRIQDAMSEAKVFAETEKQ